jgi:hypothetical protein
MIWQLYIVYVFHIIVCIVTGIGESYRIIDPVLHSAKWHQLQFIERTGLFITGAAISLIIGIHWVLFVAALTMGMIFFIIYDGIINVKVFERNFFYVSKTTAAWTEKFAHWWIKIPLLVFFSLLNVLLLRKLKKKEE